jgi:hypothetical protein
MNPSKRKQLYRISLAKKELQSKVEVKVPAVQEAAVETVPEVAPVLQPEVASVEEAAPVPEPVVVEAPKKKKSV